MCALDWSCAGEYRSLTLQAAERKLELTTQLNRLTSTLANLQTMFEKRSRSICNVSRSRYDRNPSPIQTSLTASLQVGSKVHPLKMAHVLAAISKDLKTRPLARASQPKVTWDPYPQNNPSSESHLTQDYLWPVCWKAKKPRPSSTQTRTPD